MQHPGGTCVAIPNVDACPQLSCAALTFMYLQQVSSYYREYMNLHLVHVLFVAAGQGKWNGTGELHASPLAGQNDSVRKHIVAVCGSLRSASACPAELCRSNALLPLFED